LQETYTVLLATDVLVVLVPLYSVSFTVVLLDDDVEIVALCAVALLIVLFDVEVETRVIELGE